MYDKILFCLDNSDHSLAGADIGLAVAKKTGAAATGCHVYAAALHNDRFRQMEGTLPEKYRSEDALKDQREVHDTLITKGLKIISDSYMAVFQEKALRSGITANGVSREGKNYEELVKEARDGGYGLVVMGALGLGKTGSSRIGSVCERVARRVFCDILVAKETVFTGSPQGAIAAAIDGSPLSFGGLIAAIELSRMFSCRVEAVSAFDPCFHRAAFRSIAGVLSEEAGRLFKFKEQERMHEEVIDGGLARIYRTHLDTAAAIGRKTGVEVKSVLLSGKPSEEILKYAKKTSPFLLVMGRTGAHAVPGLDIGSTVENCLREAPCNIFISSTPFTPESGPEKKLDWSAQAASILERIPSFARGIARNMVEDLAAKEGLTEVTAEFMRKARKNMGE